MSIEILQRRDFVRSGMAAGVLLCALLMVFGGLGAGCKSREGSVTAPAHPARDGRDAGADGRVPFVSPGSELYRRVEGIGAKNACTSDAACMASGCSGEVCSAERLVTTCEVRDWPHTQGAACGCVRGQCIWYR